MNWMALRDHATRARDRVATFVDEYPVARTLRVLSTVILLLLVVYIVDLERVWRTVRLTNLELFALAVGLAIVGIALSAWKWQLLLSSKGQQRRFLETFRIYYVGKFFNLVLPSTVGGDVVRGYSMSNSIEDGIEAYASIFVDRFTGLVALVALAVLGVLIEPTIFTWRLVLPLVGVTLGTVVLVAVAFWGVGVSLISSALRAVPLDIISKIEKLRRSVYLYRNERRYVALALGIALVFQILSVANKFILAEALSLDVPLVFFFVMVPITEIILFLPISIQGYGAREALYIFFLLSVGVSADQAVALSFLVHAQTLASASLGAAGLLK
jgi:uncharacterized protein (TIRG00374 family)